VKQKFNLDKLLTYRFRWADGGPLDWGTHCRLEWDRVLGVGLERPSPPCRVPLLSDTETPGARIRLEASGTGREGRRRRGRVSLRYLDSISSMTTGPFLSAQYRNRSRPNHRSRSETKSELQPPRGRAALHCASSDTGLRYLYYSEDGSN
jgi:hypothetical protein